MYKKVCKKIYKLIKKYDSIVIARHVGPDPDALGSQLALKESILATFPNKKVYAVGHPASRFKYLGELDGISEEIMSKSLVLLVLLRLIIILLLKNFVISNGLMILLVVRLRWF